MSKIAYGLSLPGLLVGAVLALHFPAKYSEAFTLPGLSEAYSQSLYESYKEPITWPRTHSNTTLSGAEFSRPRF